LYTILLGTLLCFLKNKDTGVVQNHAKKRKSIGGKKINLRVNKKLSFSHQINFSNQLPKVIPNHSVFKIKV